MTPSCEPNLGQKMGDQGMDRAPPQAHFVL